MDVWDNPKEEYMRGVEKIRNLWVRSEHNNQTGRRATRRFRRAGRPRSWDGHHQSKAPQSTSVLPSKYHFLFREQEWEGDHFSDICCILGTNEKSTDMETQNSKVDVVLVLVPKGWILTAGPYPMISESPFIPLSLHHLNWKLRMVTDLLSDLNSNKLPFHNEC